jgi:hypothetical protein
MLRNAARQYVLADVRKRLGNPGGPRGILTKPQDPQSTAHPAKYAPGSLNWLRWPLGQE